MFATIRWRERGIASADEHARAWHNLARRLETPDGGHAAVYICEDRASLAAMDEMIAGWSPPGHPAPASDLARQITGEIIAQKGL